MNKIKDLEKNIIDLNRTINVMDSNICKLRDDNHKLQSTVNSLERKLDKTLSIINALCVGNVKEDPNVEMFFMKTYRDKPVVFKDGKRVDIENVSSLSIDWDIDSRCALDVSHNKY